VAHIIFAAYCIRVTAATIQVAAPVVGGGAIGLRKRERLCSRSIVDNNNNTSGSKSINEEQLVQQQYNQETAQYAVTCSVSVVFT
jgi:hypothetical protein